MLPLKHRGTFETEESYRGIPIHAAAGVHARVAERLGKLLSPGARVADLGAGHGALSLRLHDAGFAVDAYDFDAGDWPLTALPCEFVDLNEPLDVIKHKGPYDAICAIEVIEHLENPLQFIRNLCAAARGRETWIVLSTPNPADTFSCISLFTRGVFNWFSTDHYEGGGHISILPHWMIAKHLEHCGARVHECCFLSPYRHPKLLKRIAYRFLTWIRSAVWKGPKESLSEGQTTLMIAQIPTDLPQ